MQVPLVPVPTEAKQDVEVLVDTEAGSVVTLFEEEIDWLFDVTTSVCVAVGDGVHDIL